MELSLLKYSKDSYEKWYEKYGPGILVLTERDPLFDQSTWDSMSSELDSCSFENDKGYFKEAFLGYRSRGGFAFIEIEYQNRQVDVVRDELIRKFTFTSGRLPQWLHVRLRDIAFLSNTEPILNNGSTNYKLDSNLRVTDYNKNQEVVFERFNIVRDGGYPMSSEVNSLLKRTAVNFKSKQVTPRHRLCE